MNIETPQSQSNNWIKRHPISFVLQLVWVAMYFFIGCSNIESAGEGGLAIQTILFMLSMPLDLISLLTRTTFEGKSIYLYLFITGYVQWFLIIPYIIRIFRENRKKFLNLSG